MREWSIYLLHFFVLVAIFRIFARMNYKLN